MHLQFHSMSPEFYLIVLHVQLLVRYANGSADRLYFSDDFLSIYDDAKVERVKQLNKTLDSLNEIVDAKFGEYIKELQ